MKLAQVAGIRLQDFWAMTPWQTVVYVEAFSDRAAAIHRENCWLIWHQAAMQRMGGDMPSLDLLMGIQKQKSKFIDEDGTLAMMKALARVKDNGN